MDQANTGPIQAPASEAVAYEATAREPRTPASAVSTTPAPVAHKKKSTTEPPNQTNPELSAANPSAIAPAPKKTNPPQRRPLQSLYAPKNGALKSSIQRLDIKIPVSVATPT